MSTRETTNIRPLGWPKPGELQLRGGRWAMPIYFGNGEVVVVDDPGWARQVATAFAIAANALEAKLGIDMLPLDMLPLNRQGEQRRPAPEQTGVMPAIPDDPPAARPERRCAGCGTRLRETLPEELVAVAVGAPVPPARCPRCRGEAGDRRVAP